MSSSSGGWSAWPMFWRLWAALSSHFSVCPLSNGCLSSFFCFVLCSFDFFCMPVLLDYLVSQVVSVPDHIMDTFKFSKYLGLALDPAPTLYPQNIRNIRHTQNIFENIFQIWTLTLKSPKLIEMTPPPKKKNVKKINHNSIISPNIFIFLISCPPPPQQKM